MIQLLGLEMPNLGKTYKSILFRDFTSFGCYLVLKLCFSQNLFDPDDPPVHHVRRGHDVGAGFCEGERDGRNSVDARLVLDQTGFLVHDPAVAVRRVGAEANVASDQDGIAKPFLDGLNGGNGWILLAGSG